MQAIKALPKWKQLKQLFLPLTVACSNLLQRTVLTLYKAFKIVKLQEIDGV